MISLVLSHLWAIPIIMLMTNMCLWLFMIVYDCLCLFMIVYDCLWLFMIVYDVYVILCLCLCLCFCLRWCSWWWSCCNGNGLCPGTHCWNPRLNDSRSSSPQYVQVIFHPFASQKKKKYIIRILIYICLCVKSSSLTKQTVIIKKNMIYVSFFFPMND